MRYTFLLVSLMMLGCKHIEYGPNLTEQAKVKQLVYVPSGHGSDFAPGFSMDGDITITSIDVDIPARYGIVFECQHGTFAVKESEANWKTLREGETVTVIYREVIEEENGERHVIDLDYLGIQ